VSVSCEGALETFQFQIENKFYYLIANEKSNEQRADYAMKFLPKHFPPAALFPSQNSS